ncbi:hypothetical protein [Opitutus terrae]|nr:hypothetical protein [Opitutus terrae]
MRSPASEFLSGYVMDKAADEPVHVRLRLYRALATTLPARSARFAELTKLADELESIETRSRQLRLDLGEEGHSTGSGQGGER